MTGEAQTNAAAPPAAPTYSLGELMVAAAAREIRDGEWAFVGMRLPLLAFLVAKRLHAPRAVGLYENGLIREQPAPEMLYTMADPPNQRGATFCGQMIDVMSLLQQGRVDVGFLGAAEVDRHGNLNSTWGSRDGHAVQGDRQREGEGKQRGRDPMGTELHPGVTSSTQMGAQVRGSARPPGQ